MKTTIPTTSSRPVEAPATTFDTDGFRGVVVSKCIVCTGILYQELLISHGIRDRRKTDFRASGANIAPCAGLMRDTMTFILACQIEIRKYLTWPFQRYLSHYCCNTLEGIFPDPGFQIMMLGCEHH
jgi:hypothetical protein